MTNHVHRCSISMMYSQMWGSEHLNPAAEYVETSTFPDSLRYAWFWRQLYRFDLTIINHHEPWLLTSRLMANYRWKLATKEHHPAYSSKILKLKSFILSARRPWGESRQSAYIHRGGIRFNPVANLLIQPTVSKNSCLLDVNSLGYIQGVAYRFDWCTLADSLYSAVFGWAHPM